MAIPENIKKYRPKGTEIQAHNGRYYVYKVKAIYDSSTKKSKRVSEGCIGQIIDGIGFVANEKNISQNNTVKEYGATAFLMSVSAEVKTALIDTFGKDGLRIYTLSILKLLSNSNRKNMEVSHKRSFISEAIPDVHLSKNTLSDFIGKLGLERQNMVDFFKKIPHTENGNIIFDGSSFCSGSVENPFVDYGYNPNNPGKPQIRLIYGFDIESNIPVYFNIIPGNITDKMSFVGSLKESGLSNCTIILDNGFHSADNLTFMHEQKVNFIIPLSKNLNVVKKFDLGIFENIRNHFYYHKRTIHFIWADKSYLGKYNLYVFYDVERRRELMNNYYKRSNIKEENLSPTEIQQIDNDTKYFGVTFLVSSKELGAETTFRQYKKRWAIEEMFDTHKNTLGFDMSYETNQSSQLGWAFIEFVSLLIYLKTEDNLNKHKETKGLTVHDALLRFASVVKCKIGNDWQIWNLDKATKKQLEALSVDIS